MITWSVEEHGVGHPEIDKQHQRLFDMINELERVIDDRSDAAHERFHIILHDLSEYARFHFDAEEKELSRADYVEYVNHCGSHMRYRERMCDFLFATMHGDATRRELYAFLVDWWVTHVVEEDKMFKQLGDNNV